MDDWGDELPVINIEQVNQRFDKGSERMAAIERGLGGTTRELGQNNAELAKTRQELHELKQQLADLLEFFDAMQGAFKVLRWLGMLAKPMAAIVALGVALIGAWNAAKGIYPKMNYKHKLIAAIGAAATALVVPLVARYEGTVLRTYRDPIGIITACTGHTGPALRMGQTFTRQQCEAMLYQDLAQHADALGCIRQPLTDGQRAAFLSFVFNVGEGAFCQSTLVRKANAGDLQGACAELSRWTYAGGQQLPGLVQRRAAERQLCEGGLA